jgi:hypothetical protein
LRAFDLFGDCLDGSKIALADDWKSSLNHVYLQCAQLTGHSKLLAQVHGGTRALFAIA